MNAFREDVRGGEEEPRRNSPAPSAEKPPRPSVPQTLAGMLTAITVTYLMSFLGVAGTVIGVGLVSVLTVLGNFMYSSAIYSAKEKVKLAPPKVRRRGQPSEPLDNSVTEFGYSTADRSDAASDGPESFSSGAGDSATAEPVREESETAYSESPAQSSPGRLRQAWTAMMERYGPKRIFGSIALVFVLLAGTVTVIELSAGQPLSDIVRNEESSGTSFFGGAGGAGGEGDDPEIEDDDSGEVPPPEQDDIQEEPPAPEAPPEEEAPAEEPQQEEQPAPEEGAPEG
ncbi:hypothetical protein [Nesterenkonia haasae]|uniref:hypothetical protein n=1 Tax=Nesterenkonia haasae TaxID=2587813 RepID=UPI001391819A|nr:hypothetical protein [Nesterenkonia haasae]NDK32390.1 hypothetical protein [Nesterenkonia haasae]